MFRFFAGLMLILSLNHTIAQSKVSIKGQITNQDAKPLSFADVLIEELKLGTVADEKGYYVLKQVPSGTYTLTVKVLGFKTQKRPISVAKQDLNGIDFRLSDETLDLSEVEVQCKSDSQVLQESAKAVTVVLTETVKLRTADLGEVMAKTEGISIQRGGGIGSNTRFALNASVLIK